MTDPNPSTSGYTPTSSGFGMLAAATSNPALQPVDKNASAYGMSGQSPADPNVYDKPKDATPALTDPGAKWYRATWDGETVIVTENADAAQTVYDPQTIGYDQVVNAFAALEAAAALHVDPERQRRHRLLVGTDGTWKTRKSVSIELDALLAKGDLASAEVIRGQADRLKAELAAAGHDPGKLLALHNSIVTLNGSVSAPAATPLDPGVFPGAPIDMSKGAANSRQGVPVDDPYPSPAAGYTPTPNVPPIVRPGQ